MPAPRVEALRGALTDSRHGNIPDEMPAAEVLIRLIKAGSLEGLPLQIAGELGTAIASFWSDHKWTDNPLDHVSEWTPQKQQRGDMMQMDRLMRGEGASDSAGSVANATQHVR